MLLTVTSCYRPFMPNPALRIRERLSRQIVDMLVEDLSMGASGPFTGDLQSLKERWYGLLSEWHHRKDEALRAARPAEEPDLSEGARRIREERERHRQIGWTEEHDDEHHSRGELAMAAAVYATPPERRSLEWKTSTPPGEFPSRGDASWQQPKGWPFGPGSFKPADRIRELEKAGALVAAEIDRLLRSQKESSSEKTCLE